MPILITQPTVSITGFFDDNKIHHLVDCMADDLLNLDNWFARRKYFFEVLEELSKTFSDADGDDTDEFSPWEMFVRIVPSFVGAVLEKLAEPELVSLEQMVFYAISAHPEHQDAARRWVQANSKNAKSHHKYIKAHKFYLDILVTWASFTMSPFDA